MPDAKPSGNAGHEAENKAYYCCLPGCTGELIEKELRGVPGYNTIKREQRNSEKNNKENEECLF